MKKLAALAQIMLFFVVSACSPVSALWDGENALSKPAAPSVTGVEVVEVFDSASYLLETDEQNNAVHQYGSSDWLMEYDQNITCSISYPVSGVHEIDDFFKQWAQKLKDDCFANVSSSDGAMELTVNYNSYRKGSYAGVKEMGRLFNVSSKAKTDIVFVKNLDIDSGRIIDDDDIFADGGRRIMAQKLAEAMAKEADGENYSEKVDESWLKYCVLTDKGVEVILPKGELLSSDESTKVIVLPYQDISDALKIDFDAKSKEDEAASKAGESVGGQNGNSDAPLTHSSIDPSKPMVALTFDDGPSGVTTHILDLLNETGSHATFCMVGSRMENYSDTVKRVVGDGHEIVSHTLGHKKLTSLSQGEMIEQMVSVGDKADSIVGGYDIKLVRPPYGSFNDDVKKTAESCGLALVNWSIDTLDWKTKDPENTFNTIKSEVRDGSIILCHDIYEQTGQAMDVVIPYLISEGYQLVTVSELLYYKQGGVQPGVLYRHG